LFKSYPAFPQAQFPIPDLRVAFHLNLEEKKMDMKKTREPDEIIKARELLKEFDKAPALSKKSCFSEAMQILNDFLTEHPDSEFSERANNLKNIYTELLIKRLGATSFSDPSDWLKTFAWLTEFNSERESVLENHPELEKDWRNFVEQWADEFAKAFKLSQA
jgi:hypothetical protein